MKTAPDLAVSWIGGMREPPAEDEHEITPWVSTLRLFLLGVTIHRSEQLLLGRLTVYDGPSG